MTVSVKRKNRLKHFNRLLVGVSLNMVKAKSSISSRLQEYVYKLLNKWHRDPLRLHYSTSRPHLLGLQRSQRRIILHFLALSKWIWPSWQSICVLILNLMELVIHHSCGMYCTRGFSGGFQITISPLPTNPQNHQA